MFTNMTLNNCQFTNMDLTKCCFENCQLLNVKFIKCKFTINTFKKLNKNLIGIYFYDCIIDPNLDIHQPVSIMFNVPKDKKIHTNMFTQTKENYDDIIYNSTLDFDGCDPQYGTKDIYEEMNGSYNNLYNSTISLNSEYDAFCNEIIIANNDIVYDSTLEEPKNEIIIANNDIVYDSTLEESQNNTN